MACHDVSIGNPCDAEFVLSEPSLYTYSLSMLRVNMKIWATQFFNRGGGVAILYFTFENKITKFWKAFKNYVLLKVSVLAKLGEQSIKTILVKLF